MAFSKIVKNGNRVRWNWCFFYSLIVLGVPGWMYSSVKTKSRNQGMAWCWMGAEHHDHAFSSWYATHGYSPHSHSGEKGRVQKKIHPVRIILHSDRSKLVWWTVFKGIIRPFQLKLIDFFNYSIDVTEFSYSNDMHQTTFTCLSWKKWLFNFDKMVLCYMKNWFTSTALKTIIADWDFYQSRDKQMTTSAPPRRLAGKAC